MTRATRVLQVVTSLAGFGGIQRLVTNLATGLDPSRFEVEIATGACEEPYRSLLGDAGIRVHDVPLVRPIRPGTDLIALARLYRLIRAGRYDIVHTHMSKAGLLGRVAARAAGTPAVVTGAYNFGALYFPRGSVLSSVFRLYDKFMAAYLTDLVLSDSETLRQEVVRLRMIAPEKIASFTTGIDLREFAPDADPGAHPRTGRTEPGPLVVGTVARMIPVKGLDDLVLAAARVVQSFPGARFDIVGDGPERGRLESMIRELGLAGSVALLPSRPFREVVHGFDVFVLSSRTEGLPQTVLEAMAAGRPIVSTRVGGVGEAIRHGESGMLVPPGDVQAMSQAILALLADASLRRSIGEAARGVAETRFPVSRMVSQIDAIYRMQLSGRVSRNPGHAREDVRRAPGDAPRWRRE